MPACRTATRRARQWPWRTSRRCSPRSVPRSTSSRGRRRARRGPRPSRTGSTSWRRTIGCSASARTRRSGTASRSAGSRTRADTTASSSWPRHGWLTWPIATITRSGARGPTSRCSASTTGPERRRPVRQRREAGRGLPRRAAQLRGGGRGAHGGRPGVRDVVVPVEGWGGVVRRRGPGQVEAWSGTGAAAGHRALPPGEPPRCPPEDPPAAGPLPARARPRHLPARLRPLGLLSGETRPGLVFVALPHA